MKKILCLILTVIVCLFFTPTCFADSEDSFQKLIISAKNLSNDYPTPQIVLTQDEENEIIEAFIDLHKAEGRIFTKQQAAILIGQISGYAGAAMNMAEAFSGLGDEE